MSDLVPPAPRSHLTAPGEMVLPACVTEAGPNAWFAWEEFFCGMLANPHTRRAYTRAARDFFAWLAPTGTQLPDITPGLVGRYFHQHPGSIPSRKLALAALRALFDVLVQRHVMLLNPAASVRGEKYRVVEGKTPEITVPQARSLLASIEPDTLIGKRDKALIAMLAYTGARVGAVARLRVRDLQDDGTQWLLRFREKGGQEREIPVRYDLQELLLQFRRAAGPVHATKDAPVFPSVAGRTGQLTHKPLSGNDIYRMLKRRLCAAGVPNRLCPHSFRVATVTDLLDQKVPLEDVQYLVGHADPRTTRLYDRRQQKVSRNIVERITI
ncbi:Tyrosine recombinase XerD [Gemmata sp. SH-PL17]|uniref:tyrosine-type recombinase/integrase n=1 Tax=Gemmata sp. SH-PL17 TaxID=1630693 RepID=UPI00078E82F3|nr:tyrosine-type recombinase/integrase [Gemmata sp. SH-PL17]AMV24059.1 Tyrosine recombinase XerD [Gemmata sp. SH-PL17]